MSHWAVAVLIGVERCASCLEPLLKTSQQLGRQGREGFAAGPRAPTASLGQSSRRVKDLIQVAREALVRSAPRCRAGEPPASYLRRCISGALQHHLRDRVRLVRVPRRVHELSQNGSMAQSWFNGAAVADV